MEYRTTMCLPGTSVQSTSTRSGDESTASPHRLEEEEHLEEERRNSFAEEEDEEDLLPALALINSQQALLELIERHSEEGVQGLADLENLPGRKLYLRNVGLFCLSVGAELETQIMPCSTQNIHFTLIFQSTYCLRSWSCWTTSRRATWWTTTSCSTSTSRT